MFILGLRKQKRALLKNAKNAKEISEMYYLEKNYVDIRKDIKNEKKYYVFKTEEIMEKFNIPSRQEIMFIIHRYQGEIYSVCEYCGNENSRIKNRDNEYNYHRCDHKGICPLCEEPYNCANDDGICYSCKPYYHEGDEDPRDQQISYIVYNLDNMLYEIYEAEAYVIIEIVNYLRSTINSLQSKLDNL